MINQFPLKVIYDPTPPRVGRWKNLTGRIFTRWQVLALYGRADSSLVWLCLCECGNIREMKSNVLLNGKSRSCGCLKTESVRTMHITHGESGSPELAAFYGAKKRCNNINSDDYHNYGGRGIEFRLESFEQFLKEVGRKPSKFHSLHRIDNDGHYEVGNIEWATKKVQARHTRKALIFTINGIERPLKEWCEIYNVKYLKVYHRLYKRKMPIEEALSLPTNNFIT